LLVNWGGALPQRQRIALRTIWASELAKRSFERKRKLNKCNFYFDRVFREFLLRRKTWNALNETVF
jgi:hypothetical protein